jgi:hypothetical protein
VRAAAEGVHRYPDGACFDLRRKLAGRLFVGEEQLVFGCGADELLELVCKTFLGPGDEAVFAWPSFAMYPIVVKGMGATPVQVPLTDALVHDLPAMREAITERTRVVFVCNPNNPTGTSVGAAALDAFIESLPEDLVLVVDEALPDEGEGYFVKPTLFADCHNGMRIVQEEIFGPVLAVIPFDTEEEAIRLANDNVYGLTASVFTRDISRAHRCVRKLEAGTVWVNTHDVIDSNMPFGGRKQSGIGKDMGPEQLELYLETKSVWIAL